MDLARDLWLVTAVTAVGLATLGCGDGFSTPLGPTQEVELSNNYGTVTSISDTEVCVKVRTRHIDPHTDCFELDVSKDLDQGITEGQRVRISSKNDVVTDISPLR